jgi:hypothetical protein
MKCQLSGLRNSWRNAQLQCLMKLTWICGLGCIRVWLRILTLRKFMIFLVARKKVKNYSPTVRQTANPLVVVDY